MTGPAPTPGPAPDLSLPERRQRNYQRVIDTGKAWCRERGIDPRPVLYRLVFGVFSESGGLMYASEGAAFPASADTPRTWKGYPPGESPWTWEEGKPIPELDLTTQAGRERRAAIRAALSQSKNYPYDAIGDNGGSCDLLQGLSDDYLGARFKPGRSFGWGTLAQRMDPKTGIEFCCTKFLERLIVSDNREYRGIDFDPIAADVLRVQQPRVDESSNERGYSPARVAQARDIVDRWSPTYFVGG